MFNNGEYINALFYLVLCIVVGVLMEYLVKRELKNPSDSNVRTKNLLLSSFSGFFLISGLLIGAYTFVHLASLEANIVQRIDPIISSLFVATVTIVVSKVVARFMRRKAGLGNGHAQAISIVPNLIRIGIFIIGSLAILKIFDISIAPVLTALGVGALAVALALQNTLSNLFSGIQFVASGQLKIDEYVKLDSGEEGYVEDITWRNTIIRTLSGNFIIIPNSKIASATITNFNRPNKEMAILIDLGVSYDSDLDRVEAISIATGIEVMKETTGAVPDFVPMVRFHSFGESSIKFTVILRGKEFVDQYMIKHEFTRKIMQRYREHGITIPFPTHHVILDNVKAS